MDKMMREQFRRLSDEERERCEQLILRGELRIIEDESLLNTVLRKLGIRY